MDLPFPEPDAAAPPPPRRRPARAPVRLLLGTPRGGKTGRLLTEYAAALKAGWADGRLGGCLWLTPNRSSRAAVTADLAGELGGPLIAGGVMTFDDLTDDLLADRTLRRRAGGDFADVGGFRALGAVSRRRALRATIDAARAAGRLPHFGRIAETAGFLRTLERQVRAWKYAEHWPDDETLAGGGPARRELVLLYAEYQRRLQNPPDGGPPLFDAEGRAWAARSLLRDADDASEGPARRLDLLVADGFTSFTRTQRDLLATLAAGADAAVIALPLERYSDADDAPRPGRPRRPDLFAGVWETVSELLDRFAESGTEPAFEWHAPRRPDDALGHLAARLFDESETPPEPRTEAKGVTLLAAGRAEDEVRSVVAAVKGVLHRGVRADRVVVTARRTNDYAADLYRLCDAAGVPLDADRRLPLNRRPAVRSLLAPWRVEIGGWGYREVVGLLRDPAFARSAAAGSDGAPPDAAATAVARALRFANVGEGRRSALRAVRRLAPPDPDAADTGEDEEEPARVDWDAPCEPDRRLAAAALAELDALLAPAREPADAAAWVGRLRDLAAAAGFDPAAADVPREPWEEDAADAAAAFELLTEAAAETAAEEEEAPALTLAEFLSWADELLSAATVPGPPAAPGGVVFCDAETARTAGCDHLFLLGLGEGQFPAPPDPADLAGEDPEDRDAATDAAARAEMLLFFGVVTRPAASLTLSWPTRDEQGRELFEGAFVSAVRDLFAPAAFPDPPAAGLSPVPGETQVLTAADARVRATADLRDGGDPAPLARLLATPAEAPAALNVVGAAAMLSARSAVKGPTAFGGKLSAKNRRRWKDRLPRGYQFSASELETFAANPFRYFLDRVLRVERPDPPALREDRAARGSAMHAVLAAAHRKTLAEPDGPPVVELLREQIAELPPRRGSFAAWHGGLWETERSVLAEWAEAYPAQCDRYAEKFAAGWDAPPAVSLLEVAFGSRTPEEEDEDRGDRKRAARFPNESTGVPVTGRIDRLDAGSCDGKPAFAVIDYKTGSSLPKFDADDLAAGTSLQLAIYAAAARRLGLVPADAAVRSLLYWAVKSDGPTDGVKNGRGQPVAKSLPDFEAVLDVIVPRLAAAVRGGVFPICPEKSETDRHGDVARVARAAEVRAVAERLEKWPPPWRGIVVRASRLHSESGPDAGGTPAPQTTGAPL